MRRVPYKCANSVLRSLSHRFMTTSASRVKPAGHPLWPCSQPADDITAPPRLFTFAIGYGHRIGCCVYVHGPYPQAFALTRDSPHNSLISSWPLKLEGRSDFFFRRVLNCRVRMMSRCSRDIKDLGFANSGCDAANDDSVLKEGSAMKGMT
ncbi:hypothetical protein BDN72DRAFT_413139 [Pluteus cervinus]|uniref:Uncharacterized protein n=1 Tax=Pluteus cervinus TaxID=181527 RepID=A0ACD3A9I4_9AGAR|nr:hypothetical protein BDN72DRAFT_413139 [Pluteus cervinus]